ncbi:hypothetical protein [Planotetraspora sp. GP83]
MATVKYLVIAPEGDVTLDIPEGDAEEFTRILNDAGIPCRVA